MNINPHLTSCIKLNSKWITDTKPKLEEACKLTQHLSGDPRQIRSFRYNVKSMVYRRKEEDGLHLIQLDVFIREGWGKGALFLIRRTRL